MNKRVLGRTGIEVSELSFGTVSLGIPYGIGVHGAENMPSEEDAVSLLREALDKGMNFFDTARAYGCSEERLGKAFRDRRDRAVICTKCSHMISAEGELLGESELKTTIDESLRKSLAALQTDYVDLFMLHNGQTRVTANETVRDTFAELKRQGRVRAIGASTYTLDETRAVIESGVWDVVQLPFNLMDQSQGELFGRAAERGVGIVVRSVLFKGILTDRGRNLDPHLKAVEEHRERYNELLNDRISSLSDLATKFVLSQKEVSSVLVGIDKPEYLDRALAVADGDTLDEETLARARQLEYPDIDFLDLPKWDRLGWLT